MEWVISLIVGMQPLVLLGNVGEIATSPIYLRTSGTCNQLQRFQGFGLSPVPRRRGHDGSARQDLLGRGLWPGRRGRVAESVDGAWPPGGGYLWPGPAEPCARLHLACLPRSPSLRPPRRGTPRTAGGPGPQTSLRPSRRLPGAAVNGPPPLAHPSHDGPGRHWTSWSSCEGGGGASGPRKLGNERW